MQSVTHLLDMDDVKTFCRLERKLEIKVHIVRNFRRDIEWVSEWMDNCAKVLFRLRRREHLFSLIT
jgi:hypothetical protein